MVALQQIIRKDTAKVKVGDVLIGAKNPVVIQSMTNTSTKDVESTTLQIIDLHNFYYNCY